MQILGSMHTYALRLLFSSFLALTLSACGNSKFDKNEGQRTFVHSVTPSESKSSDSDNYRIRLRGQNFEPVRQRNQSFQGLAPTELSKNVQSAILEDNTMTLKIDNQLVKFQIDYEENLKFNELDDTGEYSISGECLDYSCSKAYFKIEDLDANEVAELQYVRTYEYLASDSNIQLNQVSQKLIQEAIQYRFPIARHSLRVNESRDLDKLVIERPKVDYSEVSYQAYKAQQKGNVIVISPNNPTPSDTPKVKHDRERIELEADGIITVTATPGKKETPDAQTAIAPAAPPALFASGFRWPRFPEPAPTLARSPT